MYTKVSLVTRYLLGLIFLVFGANGLAMMFGSPFIPLPPPNLEMQTVMGGLFAAKYLMPLVKVLEICAGIMLLSNRYTNLALVFLGPIVVNILGVHLFVDQGGLPMAVILGAGVAILICDRWEDFQHLLKR